MKGHMVEHQMLGLNNPNSKDFNKVTGFLTVSVHIQEVGCDEETKELTMGSEEEIQAKKPMMPTSIRRTYQQLYLRLLIAENLPKMDKLFGTIDAYCKLKFGRHKLQTRVYQ